MGQAESTLSVLGAGRHLSSEDIKGLSKRYQSWLAPDPRLIKASKARQFVHDLVAADQERELLLWVECHERDGRICLGDFLAKVFAWTDASLTASAQTWLDSLSSEPRTHLALSQVVSGTAQIHLQAKGPVLK